MVDPPNIDAACRKSLRLVFESRLEVRRRIVPFGVIVDLELVAIRIFKDKGLAVTEIPVAADAMTRFNPDSFHLLITGAGPMRDGKDIMLKLTFANAGTVTILAMVTDPESGGSSYFLN